MYFDYALRRFGVLVAVIILAVSVNFLIPRLMPGDPVEQKLALLAGQGAGYIGDVEEIAASYRAKFGLDQPIWKQYLTYWWDLLHLDLGYSLDNYPERVSDVIRASLPWTIGLLGACTIISFALGTLLGGLMAWPKAPRFVRGLVPVLMVTSSIPFFLLGIVLIFFLAIQYQVFPAASAYTPGTVLGFNWASIQDILRHAALPALSIVLASIGTWALGMRGMVISVLGEDYITLAEAKGLKNRRIFTRYGLRTCLLPQVTRLVLALGFVVSGTVLVEVIFAYPGIGFKLYQAVHAKDYLVLQGIVLLLILSIAFSMFFLDLLYPILDPRIMYRRR